MSIDDDPEISRTLSIRLAPYGARVARALFGMQGLSLALSESPDVVVTDLCMPQGDGDHVIEWLKRNRQTRDVPVIVLTGMNRRGIGREMMNLGAAAFFTKPANFDDLLSALRAFIPLEKSADEAELEFSSGHPSWTGDSFRATVDARTLPEGSHP